MATKLEEMREINKKLLNERLSESQGESQTLFQLLLLNDINGVVDNLKADYGNLRQNNEELRRKIEVLTKEKKHCLVQLRLYKQLLAEKISPGNDSWLDQTLTSEPTSHRQSSLFDKSGFGSILPQDHSQHELGGAKYVGYLQSLHKQIDCFRAIVRTQNIWGLCSIIAREVKKAVNAEKCTVYIIESDLQKIYEESFEDPRTIGKVRCGTTWLYVHTESNSNFEEPLFPSINSLIKGHRTDEAIMRSIVLSKIPHIGIQVQNPLDRSKPEFTGSDDQKIKIICELAAVKLDSLLIGNEVKIERANLRGILEISSQIVSCRDHRGITEKVSYLFPKYFQFAEASIAFYDAENNEFFTCVPEANKGHVYSDEVARFPATIGISGTVLQNGGVLAVSDMKSLRRNFHPEMDNLAGVSDVRNMMIGCLIGTDNEAIGVLQLFNKLTGISPEDQSKMNDILKLVGASISCSNTMNECVSLVIQMKASVDIVVQAMEGSEVGRADFEATQIFNHISGLRTKLGNWTKTKKKQMAVIQS